MNSTKQIRDNYAQKKYRRKSKSKNKTEQHVAHTVDLEIVKTIHKKKDLKKKKTPKPKSTTAATTTTKPREKKKKTEQTEDDDDIKRLKKSFNKPANFRMVSRDTNMVKHRELASELIDLQNQRKKTVQLSKSLSKRAKSQVKVIQEDTSLPIEFKKDAKEFYKKFKDSDGKTIWDARKDESALKS